MLLYLNHIDYILHDTYIVEKIVIELVTNRFRGLLISKAGNY